MGKKGKESMNREEWLATYGRNGRNKWYIRAHKILEVWKIENNISEMCDIHHRNDTTESIKYNEEHYDLWGFECDENGDYKFKLGKYVVFMTHREHAKYHGKFCSEQTRKKKSDNSKGEKNPFWGKKHTPETLEKLRIASTGRRHSPEAIEKIRAANSGTNNHWYGKYHSEAARAKMKGFSILWDVYKNNDGIKSYNEFKHAVKIGDIAFEMQPISVFIK